MPLAINETAPDFTADSTEGKLHFYDWAGDNWVLFFSHPKDFTPVCTTELGAVAKLKSEFDKRGVKVLGLSVDPVNNHEKWATDILETQGTGPNSPMIGDTDLAVSKAYGMLPADAPGDLPPDSRKFEFHYEGLSFLAPEKVNFRYRLEGFDDEWVEAGTRRVAFYSSLPPGDYAFHVVACNNDGVWNEAGATYRFRLGVPVQREPFRLGACHWTQGRHRRPAGPGRATTRWRSWPWWST